MIFIVRIQVHKGMDHVYEHIVTNHEKLKTSKVTPLFVTKRFSRGETSLFVEANDPDVLSDFIHNDLSKIEGVQDIHFVTLMKPQFFPVPPGTPDLNRFAVTIACTPPHCKEIYEAIAKFKPTKEQVITYVAFTYLETGQDISLSVLSSDIRSLETFVEEHISNIKGVLNTSLKEITKTRQLASLVDLKKVVGPLTRWEYLTSREYGDDVYKDVVAGC